MIFWLKLLVFYLPFQLALNPAPRVDLASIRVTVIVFFLFWLAGSLKRKKVRIDLNWNAFFFFSFIFINAMSLFWARNDEWAARKLLFLLSIAPLYIIIASEINTLNKAVDIAKALLWSGAAAAFLGMAQFFSQFIWGAEKIYKIWAYYVIEPFLGQSFSEAVLKNPSWLVNIAGDTYLRATAVFPDPHMFSFYLGMLLPLGLAVYFESRGKRYLIIALMLLLADILTFSRGGYLGLATAAIFLVVMFWNKIGKKYKVVSAVMAVFLLLFIALPGPVSKRFASSFSLKEGSNKGRLETWGKAVGIIKAHPVLGVGLGNYPIYIKPNADYREPIYAHNAYLDVAAETGAVNLIFWSGLLFGVFAACWKKSSQSVFFLGVAASILIYITHSMVETAIYSPVVFSLLLIIIGLSHVDPGKRKSLVQI